MLLPGIDSGMWSLEMDALRWEVLEGGGVKCWPATAVRLFAIRGLMGSGRCDGPGRGRIGLREVEPGLAADISPSEALGGSTGRLIAELELVAVSKPCNVAGTCATLEVAVVSKAPVESARSGRSKEEVRWRFDCGFCAAAGCLAELEARCADARSCILAMNGDASSSAMDSRLSDS